MDAKNTFHTTGMYRLMRLENLALLAVCLSLVARNLDALNWWRFLAAFWVIDFVGYLPGAIAYRRAGGGPISPVYHHLYNFMHNYLVVGTGIALWWLLAGFEWAMLAVPIHLSIDRGVFGNVLKPRALPFEPTPIPPQRVLAALGRLDTRVAERA